MTLDGNMFCLRKAPPPTGWPETINVFLYSLAEVKGSWAVAVILRDSIRTAVRLSRVSKPRAASHSHRRTPSLKTCRVAQSRPETSISCCHPRKLPARCQRCRENLSNGSSNIPLNYARGGFVTPGLWSVVDQTHGRLARSSRYESITSSEHVGGFERCGEHRHQEPWPTESST